LADAREHGRGLSPVKFLAGAATYGCLRYGTYAMVAAHRCASVRVDSRDPVVASVLIAGHAGTAGARIRPGISPAARPAVLRLAGREARDQAGCVS
jgi:hypothetical protein